MDSQSAPADSRRIGLYVHIPFCETKCPYCDFNTYARIEGLIPAYVAALRQEVEMWGALLGHPAVATVFFGGGTPSYLPSEHIGSLLRSVGEAFDLDPEAEITLEANPGDLTEAKLRGYLACGVNRLSIGVQSLDDRLLQVLGRRHSAAEAVSAVQTALDAGLDNVSIDLMYGLPDQSADDWAQTLGGAAGLGQKHVSMYCLTLEGGTPMEESVRSGRVPEPDADLAADMYLMAEESMEGMGFRHYEISNWALPGRESRHNLTYWRNQPFLGVGPGAHSYLAGSRFYNIKSPKEYVRRLTPSTALSEAGPAGASEEGIPLPDQGKEEGRVTTESLKRVPVVETVEAIDRRLEMAETMMMGIRLDTGVEVAEFVSRFGVSPLEEYGGALRELGSAGLLETGGGSVRLTGRGRLLGNEVFSRFFDSS